MFVVLVSVPLTLVDADTCVAPPVKPKPVGADQVYVVPAGMILPFTPSVGVTVKVTPLHVVVVIALIVAPGLMVTTKLNAGPVHTPEIGVTI